MNYAPKKPHFCEDIEKSAVLSKYLFSKTELMKNYLAAILFCVFCVLLHIFNKKTKFDHVNSKIKSQADGKT